MPDTPQFTIGQEYRRRELHETYGGQRQGGISTPQQFPIVLLFTGESGEQYGYSDGFQEDGTFWYTGAGQIGDMEMVRGNRAIRDHEAEGKALQLFESTRTGWVRYLGEAAYLGVHDATQAKYPAENPGENPDKNPAKTPGKNPEKTPGETLGVTLGGTLDPSWEHS